VQLELQQSHLAIQPDSDGRATGEQSVQEGLRIWVAQGSPLGGRLTGPPRIVVGNRGKGKTSLNEEHSIGSAHVRAAAGAENGRREHCR
jgi:hypothetical protein